MIHALDVLSCKSTLIEKQPKCKNKIISLSSMVDSWPFSQTSLLPLPFCFQVLTFSKHTAPNELGQFCSLFVLGGAMKYSGLVPPWDQAGGCGFVSMPHPALLSSVHSAPRTEVLRGWIQESTPSKKNVPFSAHLLGFPFPTQWEFALPSCNTSHLIAWY